MILKFILYLDRAGKINEFKGRCLFRTVTEIITKDRINEPFYAFSSNYRDMKK